MNMVTIIFGMSSYIEVIGRRIYWHTPWLIDLTNRGIKKSRVNDKASDKTFGKIEKSLKTRGVSKGSPCCSP